MGRILTAIVRTCCTVLNCVKLSKQPLLAYPEHWVADGAAPRALYALAGYSDPLFVCCELVTAQVPVKRDLSCAFHQSVGTPGTTLWDNTLPPLPPVADQGGILTLHDKWLDCLYHRLISPVVRIWDRPIFGYGGSEPLICLKTVTQKGGGDLSGHITCVYSILLFFKIF